MLLFQQTSVEPARIKKRPHFRRCVDRHYCFSQAQTKWPTASERPQWCFRSPQSEPTYKCGDEGWACEIFYQQQWEFKPSVKIGNQNGSTAKKRGNIRNNLEGPFLCYILTFYIYDFCIYRQVVFIGMDLGTNWVFCYICHIGKKNIECTLGGEGVLLFDISCFCECVGNTSMCCTGSMVVYWLRVNVYARKEGLWSAKLQSRLWSYFFLFFSTKKSVHRKNNQLHLSYK